MINIIDLLLVILAIVIIVMSAKKGFVASCLDAFSVVISGFASYKFFEPVAEWVYNFCVRDLVKTTFARALDDMSSNLSFSEKVSGMIDSLPQTALKIAEGMGVNPKSLIGSINQSVASDKGAFIDVVTDKIAYNVMITITQILVFIALFVIICLLVRFFANFFSDIFKKLPLVGGVDSLLGGVLGAVKVAIVLVVVTSVLYIIFSTAEADSPLTIIGESKFYNFLAGYNPVITFLNK